MKSQILSKTVWLNVIMLILFIVPLIDPNMLSLFGIPASAAAKVAGIEGLITAVLNYVLRVFFTSTPLTQTAIDNK